MARLVLWGLNRVAKWDPEPLRKALSVTRFLRSPLHEVVLGDRSDFNRRELGAAEGPGHALQYESHQVDEYFVPIPVKAIGNPDLLRKKLRDEDLMGPEQEARFDAFLGAYPAYFADGTWASYWTPREQPNPHRQVTTMFTRDDVGFYEIVRAARRDGQQAVLVGYSQGGLIANFLAWMDENFVKPEGRAIAGVITVQAPNAGSPLANGNNADSVARGVFEALFGALGYLPRAKAPLDSAIRCLTTGTTPSGRHFDIEAFAELVDAAIADASTLQRDSMLNVLLSARKWMTGLCPSGYRTAFDDLNTSNLDARNTVLGLVNEGLRSTLHGAVIGTDNQLSDIVHEALAERLFNLGGWFFRLATRLAPGLTERIEAAQRAYSSVAMDEFDSGAPLRPQQDLLARQFREGASVLGPKGERIALPPRAHDFIIPSISQAIGPRGKSPTLDPALAPWFLGNVVNPGGTHISGAEDGGGDSDRDRVKMLLEAMGNRLSS